MDSHYNPLILSRLRPLAAGGDQVGLRAYLATLSHSHFRTAGHLLGERIMPALPVAAAWSLMHSLVEWQPKAFTVTTAKAMAPRLHSGEATVRDEGLRNLCASLQGVAHAIDRDKLLRTWLPVLREPDTVEAMLTMLPPEAPDGSGAVEALLRVPTAARTYALPARSTTRASSQPPVAASCSAATASPPPPQPSSPPTTASPSRTHTQPATPSPASSLASTPTTAASSAWPQW